MIDEERTGKRRIAEEVLREMSSTLLEDLVGAMSSGRITSAAGLAEQLADVLSTRAQLGLEPRRSRGALSGPRGDG